MKTKTAVLALGALAQDTRLAIFRLLVKTGPSGMTAGGIAANLDMAAPTLSFHLKELAHAALVEAEPRGRFIVYRADFATMNALVGYLTENCCQGSGACDTQCAPAPADCTPKAKPRRPVAAAASVSITSRRRTA